MRCLFKLCLLAVLSVIDPSISAAAELRAGTARVDVTPPVGGPMYGYGARGANVSTGVHDPLYAKAIVVDDGETQLAIVSLDLGGISADSTTTIREKVASATSIEHVLLVASHTHSAPRATSNFPSKEAPWIDEANEKIADAIIEAAGNLQPARIGVGWGEAKEGHNRRMVTTDGKVIMLWGNRDRIYTQPVDHSLAVVRVETPDSKPIANLVNFACHPVVLGPENLEISADYVGVLTKRVEEELGGRCMFLQGAAGDINPFWDKTPPADGAFEQMEQMGQTIANEAIRVSSGIDEFVSGASLSVRTEVMPLASRRVRDRIGQTIAAEINSVLIGDEIALAAFPGEFFVEHGLWLKQQSKFAHTLFVGYTNGQLGYFPTIKATTEGGYGASTATRVEVGAGERLVSRALVNLYYQAGLIKR